MVFIIYRNEITFLLLLLLHLEVILGQEKKKHRVAHTVVSNNLRLLF